MEHDVLNVTVVVPTYNERETLPKLVAKLHALRLPNLHVLVVDDNSPDGTGDLADELASRWPQTVAVLHRATKDGLGRAYVPGITRALDEGADIVIQMDADGSHPTDAIPTMLAVLAATGAAVVLGSRYVRGGSVAGDWGWHRETLSAWANSYVNAVLRLGLRDATAGFKAWRAEALRAIDISSVRSNGYAFQVEMNYRALQRGMRIVEVPIRFEQRSAGASKMSLAVQLESALVPWKLRFSHQAARPAQPRPTASVECLERTAPTGS